MLLFSFVIFRVTIMRNKKHQSRGVAFIQFVNENDANACLELNNTEVKCKLNIAYSIYRHYKRLIFQIFHTDVWSRIENKHR